MNPWVIISIIAGSVAAFVGAAGYVFGGSPGWRDLRRYAWVAAAEALYCFTDLGWALPPSKREWVLALNEVQLASACWFVGAWFWYGAEYEARRLSRFERGAVVFFVVLGIVGALPNFTISDEVSTHSALGLQFTDITMLEPGAVVMGFVLTGAIFVTVRFCQRWYRGDSRAAVHAIGLLLITAFAVNDSLVSSGVVHGVYLVATGFLISVLLSSNRVGRRLVEYARELTELSARLERTVDERTQELAGTQMKLGRAEKLMALGQLAGGVAHEINNPAAVIRGNLGYLQEELAANPGVLPDEAPRAFEDCLQAVDRITQIVRSLSDAGKIAHRAEAASTAFNVETALEAAEYLARSALTKVKVTRTCEPGLIASGQGELFAQVVANLIRNAAQAIDSAGRGQHITLAAARRDDRIVLTVEDDGPGMPEGLHAKVFEPFFTTKDVGSGTGLGLAVSLGLMRAQGGNIELMESAPGKTVFAVEMPIEVQKVVRLRRLLLVDDEPQLLSAMQRMLRGHYLVETANGVGPALERARQGGPGIDAILCDISMPDGGGERVHAELSKWAPELAARILFVTGGAVSEASRVFIETHKERVLLKPLERAQLAKRLESMPPAVATQPAESAA